MFTLGEMALSCGRVVSQSAATVVQAFIAPQLATGSVTSDIPPPLRAHALIALGKMCLQEETLAKKCIPMFAKELENCTAPAVRNNILVVLSDLCVRYTSLVDRYVPLLAGCVSDENEVVRKHALTLLTKLLSEDYIKWKGLLLFRFLAALVDSSSSVQAFGMQQFVG